jgi:hypothetical protein
MQCVVGSLPSACLFWKLMLLAWNGTYFGSSREEHSLRPSSSSSLADSSPAATR